MYKVKTIFDYAKYQETIIYENTTWLALDIPSRSLKEAIGLFLKEPNRRVILRKVLDDSVQLHYFSDDSIYITNFIRSTEIFLQGCRSSSEDLEKMTQCIFDKFIEFQNDKIRNVRKIAELFSGRNVLYTWLDKTGFKLGVMDASRELRPIESISTSQLVADHLNRLSYKKTDDLVDFQLNDRLFRNKFFITSTKIDNNNRYIFPDHFTKDLELNDKMQEFVKHLIRMVKLKHVNEYVIFNGAKEETKKFRDACSRLLVFLDLDRYVVNVHKKDNSVIWDLHNIRKNLRKEIDRLECIGFNAVENGVRRRNKKNKKRSRF